ncbi:MAG: hypothetical protein O8C65_01600 [Candidatus Methanoperedens sp.]|nr:hypothetical protein [Candidatus Methanoperedens sp.]
MHSTIRGKFWRIKVSIQVCLNQNTNTNEPGSAKEDAFFTTLRVATIENK